MFLLFLHTEVVTDVSVFAESRCTSWCGIPSLRSFVGVLPGKLNSDFEQFVVGGFLES